MLFFYGILLISREAGIKLKNMRNQENARNLRSKINLYFDNALSQEEQNSLLNQVDSDPRCNKMFNKEKTFRDYIKNNVKRSSVSPDLIQSIKDSIRIV